MTNIETIRLAINSHHALLETARRDDDSDSAQQICGELQTLYRRKYLHEQQIAKEKEGKIV